MKLKLSIAALVLAGVLGPASFAEAGDWGVRFGISGHGFQIGVGYDRGHRHRRSHRVHARYVHRHHTCARTPIYGRAWVAPIYNTVIVGYDHCGRPIHRSVMVRAGYYNRIVTGYHCAGCGRHF